MRKEEVDIVCLQGTKRGNEGEIGGGYEVWEEEGYTIMHHSGQGTKSANGHTGVAIALRTETIPKDRIKNVWVLGQEKGQQKGRLMEVRIGGREYDTTIINAYMPNQYHKHSKDYDTIAEK